MRHNDITLISYYQEDFEVHISTSLSKCVSFILVCFDYLYAFKQITI